MALSNKTYLICGVANKKSVATYVAKELLEHNAHCIFTAQNEKNLEQIYKIFPNSPAFILDVEDKSSIGNLLEELKALTPKLDGFLHSIAFANFSPETPLFHQTSRENFLQAIQISCLSLMEITNAILPLLTENSSIVTVSISNTKATSYGYMGPIKSMLETSVCYLAKSLSDIKNVRVNSVGAGPLKTSASAGIPNYVENYLYSEALTLRKQALKTEEVAKTIKFLLSPESSGINAENIIIDAGMNSNYFDQKIVKNFNK